MQFYFDWLSLLAEAAAIFEARLSALSRARDTQYLMVTEEADSLPGTPAIFLRGGNSADVLIQYRKIIAANA